MLGVWCMLASDFGADLCSDTLLCCKNNVACFTAALLALAHQCTSGGRTAHCCGAPAIQSQLAFLVHTLLTPAVSHEDRSAVTTMKARNTAITTPPTCPRASHVLLATQHANRQHHTHMAGAHLECVLRAPKVQDQVFLLTYAARTRTQLESLCQARGAC